MYQEDILFTVSTFPFHNWAEDINNVQQYFPNFQVQSGYFVEDITEWKSFQNKNCIFIPINNESCPNSGRVFSLLCQDELKRIRSKLHQPGCKFQIKKLCPNSWFHILPESLENHENFILVNQDNIVMEFIMSKLTLNLESQDQHGILILNRDFEFSFEISQ